MHSLQLVVSSCYYNKHQMVSVNRFNAFCCFLYADFLLGHRSTHKTHEIQVTNMADLAAQPGHFSRLSSLKHMEAVVRSSHPYSDGLDRWRGRVGSHNNKGSALITLCPIWYLSLQLSIKDRNRLVITKRSPPKICEKST